MNRRKKIGEERKGRGWMAWRRVRGEREVEEEKVGEELEGRMRRKRGEGSEKGERGRGSKGRGGKSWRKNGKEDGEVPGGG